MKNFSEEKKDLNFRLKIIYHILVRKLHESSYSLNISHNYVV